MSSITKKSNNLPLSLGDKGFWRVALALAIPIALQNMLTASFSLIDTLMVGQLGPIALSATGMAGQWSWLLNMVIFGIASGASVFIAQYWGNKDIDGIHRSLGIATVSALILSVIFTIVAATAPEGVITIFNKDPEVIESGANYLRYACYSYPAIALTSLLGSTLRSTERVRLPMIVSGISALTNGVLNYLLIFPAGLGVKGAAIATVISSWLGLALLLVISLIQKNIIIASPKKLFCFTRSSLAEFFRKTSPVILNETMWGLGTVVYNVIFSNMGYEEFAAITIVRTFENLLFCFFIGICNACCVMVGKEIGSGEIREAVRDTKRFNIIMPILSVASGIIAIALRSPLVSLFNIGDQYSAHTLGIAEAILIIYGVWITVRNIPFLVIVGIFRPGGDTTTGMKWEIFILWLFAIPVTAIMAYFVKLPFLAVYATMYLCEDIPKAIIFMIHYFSGKWIRPVTKEGRAALEEYNK